jgi:hypothetical protein
MHSILPVTHRPIRKPEVRSPGRACEMGAEVHRTSHPRTSSVDFARWLAQSLDSPTNPPSDGEAPRSLPGHFSFGSSTLP